jgi:hypothetical protein
MKKIMKFYVKNVYGRDLFYPANELAEEAVSILLDRKITFTLNQIKFFKDIGVEVNIVPQDLSL